MKTAEENRVGAEPSPVMIETPRVGVECAVWGEGPAVLLLHGAMGGYNQGVLLARAAAGTSEFRFVAISRPGYLATPLALGETPEAQADLCAAVLDALGISLAAVIAISGGGQCALQFTLRHRDRCRGLVMISACSGPLNVRVPLKFHLLKLMARFPALVASMQRRAAIHPDAAARRSIPDPALRARTLNDAEAGPLLLALQLSTMDQMAQRLPGTQNDIVHSRLAFSYPLGQISVPLLVVHGTADRAVPFAQAAALAERVSGAELFAIEGGEHVSLFTHLHEIRTRVRHFLDACGRSDRQV
jgi:pimeloyl-ACP methyl ester carboxylesterase